MKGAIVADDTKTADTETVKLYNPNDRNGVRDGGPYADQLELVAAEKRRAAVEGREPDYGNLQPTAGVPVVTGATLSTLSTTGVQLDEVEHIAEVPVSTEDAPAKPGKDATDEQKIQAAQADALAKGETGTDALEVAKAEVE
jgi:hypothetical protein